MPTAIARVTVTRDPATGRWTASCSRCAWTISSLMRGFVDLDAGGHQRSHTTRDPRDQIDALGRVMGR